MVADVNVTTSGTRPYFNTPLHLLCSSSDKGRDRCGYDKVFLISKLVACKANVDAKTLEGATPLHRACATGLHDVVKCLIQHGANVDLKCKELAQGCSNTTANIIAAHANTARGDTSSRSNTAQGALRAVDNVDNVDNVCPQHGLVNNSKLTRRMVSRISAKKKPRRR